MVTGLSGYLHEREGRRMLELSFSHSKSIHIMEGREERSVVRHCGGCRSTSLLRNTRSRSRVSKSATVFQRFNKRRIIYIIKCQWTRDATVQIKKILPYTHVQATSKPTHPSPTSD